MRMSGNIVRLMAVVGLVFWQGSLGISPANAAIDNAGVMDSLLERYSAEVASWASVMISAASWLFWTLVLISMVWTFGVMALRKADIGDFFAEFVRFTVFTGFFWWLLTNGPALANSIFASLRRLAGDATGLGPGLSPSGIVDVGFAIFDRVLDQSTLWSPLDAAIGTTLAGIMLVLLAMVSIKMVLLLVAGWALAFGGVFFLGFGGARWTSSFAIKNLKVLVALGGQLMTMVLLMGIGKTFLDDYHASMKSGVNLKELGVMLVVALTLFVIINWIPQLIASVILGARISGEGGGMFAIAVPPGGGATNPSGNTALIAATTGGAAFAAGAANAAVGAQSLMAAFSGTNLQMSDTSDFGGRGRKEGEQDYGSQVDTRAGRPSSYTPFASAAGFDSGTPVLDRVDSSAAHRPAGRETSTERFEKHSS